MQNGTRTDDEAKAAPKFRRRLVREHGLAEREARAAEHDARARRCVSGTNSVSVIDAYASGKQVQSTTKEKISQTWFASHTGPIAWSITARGRAPALGAAGDQVPEPGAEVGAAEQRVGKHADEQHHRGRGAHRDRPSSARGGPAGSRPVRHASSSSAAGVAEPPAHAAQHQDRRHADADVQRRTQRGTSPTRRCCRSRRPRPS